MDLKDLWNDEREKLLAEYLDAGMAEAEAESYADRNALMVNKELEDRVSDRIASRIDAARDRMKYDAAAG